MESMTGYGSSRQEFRSGLDVLVEARSVNNRGLQVSVSPRDLPLSFISGLEEAAKEMFARGRLDVRVTVTPRADSGTSSMPSGCADVSLARDLLDASKELSRELGIENDLKVSGLLRFPGVWRGEQAAVWSLSDGTTNEELEEFALSVATVALRDLAESRAREGKAIVKELLPILDSVREGARTILDEDGRRSVERAKRLRERISELVEGLELDECRLAQETAYLASRSDVTEECTRVLAHVDECAKLLSGSVQSPGRGVLFVLQEIQRELNTMGGKLDDASATLRVVEMKNAVSSVKEQAANLE